MISVVRPNNPFGLLGQAFGPSMSICIHCSYTSIYFNQPTNFKKFLHHQICLKIPKIWKIALKLPCKHALLGPVRHFGDLRPCTRPRSNWYGTSNSRANLAIFVPTPPNMPKNTQDLEDRIEIALQAYAKMEKPKIAKLAREFDVPYQLLRGRVQGRNWQHSKYESNELMPVLALALVLY
jgi:hypothetical protein